MLALARAAALLATVTSIGAFVPLAPLGARRMAVRVAGGSTTDFKNGLTIVSGDKLAKIVEFLHVKPGKGPAFVRTKLKFLEAGSTVEKTWRAGEAVEIAVVDRKDLQFTYVDDDQHCFMDMETFEEDRIFTKFLGDAAGYLYEGLQVRVATTTTTTTTTCYAAATAATAPPATATPHATLLTTTYLLLPYLLTTYYY